jgi:transposase-like protein
MGAQIRSGDCQEPKSNPAESLTRWHLDEMVVSLSGKQMYLWRAVDGEGEVLEILVQPQRDMAAEPLQLHPHCGRGEVGTRQR